MDQVNLRLDHQFSPNDRLFARLSIYEVGSFQPFGSSVLNEALAPGFGRDLNTDTTNFDLNYTHVISTHVVNEIRFGWLSASGGQSSQNKGTDFASLTGLQGVTNDPRDVGYPQASFAGLFSTVGDPTSFVSRVDRSLELYDNVLVHRGKHDIKFGAYYFHLNFNPSNPNAARGSFQFTPRWTSSNAGLSDGNAFADFLLGYPSAAQVGIGRAEENGRTNWIHAYVQDDWKATPTLTVNLGLRYEVNQQMTDIDNGLSAIDLSVPGGRFVIASDNEGRISPAAAPLLPLIPVPFVTSDQAGWSRSLLRPSYNRIAPRVGLAWSRGETVVRAGFGIFQNQAAYSIQQALAQNLPFFLTKSINTSADALIPTSITSNILSSNAVGTLGGSNMDHNYRPEYNQAWSLDVEHQSGSKTLLAISYFGSRTVGADSSTVLNVPLPGPGPIGPRRPLPRLSGFNTIRWNGWSSYHALTVKAERRYSDGLSFVANYTWSKSIDDASDPGATNFESNLPENVNNLKAEKALSSYDHRHRFVSSFFYDLPLGKESSAWRAKFLAGWQVGGIATLQTGAPFTVNLGVDQANIGSGPAQRPNLLHNPNLNGSRDPSMWFDTSAFSLPQPFTFGNAGRNVVFAPGLTDMDFSLLKNTPLSENIRLEFRAEAFNVFNHPNFNVPNRIAFTPNFGRIFSAEDSREIQLALKLIF